jgi:hypothetical protein
VQGYYQSAGWNGIEADKVDLPKSLWPAKAAEIKGISRSSAGIKVSIIPKLAEEIDQRIQSPPTQNTVFALFLYHHLFGNLG